MAQLYLNQFHAALTHLLNLEGRGAQTRLANQQQIDRGYLNAIVKGRKPGSEKIRTKIAAHFKMPYEDMLFLGRRIMEESEDGLSTRRESGTREKQQTEHVNLGNEIIDFKIPAQKEDVPKNISEIMIKAIEVLNSGTSYGNFLVNMIEASHEAISQKKEENLPLQNQMRELKSEVAILKERLDDEKEAARKSA